MQLGIVFYCKFERCLYKEQPRFCDGVEDAMYDDDRLKGNLSMSWSPVTNRTQGTTKYLSLGPMNL